MIRNELKKIIKKAAGKEAKIERPTDPLNGDYSTNIAIIAKLDADKIVGRIRQGPMLERIETKQGFINFFLSKGYLQKQLKEILKKKERFGSLDIGRKQAVQVEFISANPTGPLTLGNGRGGFCGDVLANVLKKAGYRAEKEYYVNDRGEQIRKLGYSVIGGVGAVYKGDYIDGLKKRVKGDNPDEVGERAGEIILEEMIKPTVEKMGIKYDNWFSEKSLYKKEDVYKVLDWLRKQDLAYENDGALWFRSTKYGDDKDRVLITASGDTTYLASDIAYFKDKMDRGFDLVIDLWGADHHGYVPRFKAMVKALGYKEEAWQVILMQLVRLFRKGKEVRMSKREGVYVTLDELIDEVGVDAARFFFLTRSPGSHLNFDLDLAKEQSEKNPVYYVQYAHARICSILRKSKTRKPKVKNLELLNHPSELKLIKQLIRLSEVIEDTAKDYQVQRLPQYAKDIAISFHQFYTECRVLNENNKELTQARLALVSATKIVLKNTLALMGITAPEKM